MAIYLAPSPVESLDPTVPYVRIVVWRPLDDLTARSWTVTGASSDGVAWYAPDRSGGEEATSGSVVVRAVAADSTIDGTADLTFPTLGRVRNEFQAEWIPSSMLCG